MSIYIVKFQLDYFRFDKIIVFFLLEDTGGVHENVIDKWAFENDIISF